MTSAVFRKTDESDPLSAAFDYEAAGEAAASLGLAGKRVERALALLRESTVDCDHRAPLLREAAIAVHHYFIQREIMGMRRHDGVIREYGIPREVLVRLGAN
ncbi:MAG: DUF6665 family protein [Rhizobiaceae bacterium]